MEYTRVPVEDSEAGYDTPWEVIEDQGRKKIQD